MRNAARAIGKIHGLIRLEHAVFVDKVDVLLAVHAEVYGCVAIANKRPCARDAKRIAAPQVPVEQ